MEVLSLATEWGTLCLTKVLTTLFETNKKMSMAVEKEQENYRKTEAKLHGIPES